MSAGYCTLFKVLGSEGVNVRAAQKIDDGRSARVNTMPTVVCSFLL